MRVSAQNVRRADPVKVFVDFASVAPSRDFGFGKRLEAGGATLAYVTLEPNEGIYLEFSKMTAAIQDGNATPLEWREPGSDRVVSSAAAHGRIHLADAGVPVWKRWEEARLIFTFALDDRFVTEIALNAFSGSADRTIKTSVGADDPILERLMVLAQHELDEEGAGGRLYVEGLASSLAVHLLRRYGLSIRMPIPRKGGLAPALLRRVVEYIRAHIGTELGLIELAAIAGLSPHHFGAAFKVSAGMSPHRYVIEKRVRLARKMIQDGERSLGEIAYAVGFSSQSHFTTNFRRMTGITPGQFRRSAM